MSLSTQIVQLIILLFLSGFFSGSEVALVSLSKHKVKQMVEAKLRGSKHVLKLKNDPHRMLATILIGNNVVNVAAAAFATVIAFELFSSFALGIVTGVMTMLILIFGELTPKAIATSYNETVARLVAPFLWYCSVVLTPVLWALELFVKGFMKLFGLSSKEHAITEDEIKSMVLVAQEEGSIKEIEKRMINNIFEFDDIAVEEIATPRADMVLVNSKTTVGKAMNVFLDKGFSRLPIYKKDKDTIVGILYFKDLIPYTKRGKDKTLVTRIMRKPYFVPETKKISALLRQFQKRKEHIAMVVDEYGSVTGLVTLEDVLEEIVGEIMDESDTVEHNIRKINNKSWMVRGKTHIDVVNENLKMKLKGDDYDTFSGFILDKIGRIPKQGESIRHNRYTLTINELEGNRIVKVLVEKK